jgi:hypothetical protein
MTMRIIRKREQEDRIEHRVAYVWDPDRPNGGFSFPCDQDGKVDVSIMAEPAQRNYLACLSGQVDGCPVYGPTLERDRWTWREPAVGECEVCRREVILDRATCACECGADYNAMGQRLAPREQWGHETGEHWSDCV